MLATTTSSKSTRPGALSGKSALVTGASRGIGRAIALRLAADGATVAVHYGTDAAGATATLAEIEAAGGHGFVVGAQLGVDGDVERLFDALLPGLPDGALDIVVNNAAAPPAGAIEATTPEQFDRLFAVNVRAPYFIIRRALPLLRDGGRIVTISSVAVRMANAIQTSFAMTKGAIETMTRTLANALGVRGITVNAVAPGATRTASNGAAFSAPGLEAFIAGMTAQGRLGAAADVADVVALLVSDDARWITGQVIDASGGLFLGPRL